MELLSGSAGGENNAGDARRVVQRAAQLFRKIF